MKKVYQREMTKGRGDCFSACLASMLELPLGVIPNFRAEAGEDRTEWVLNDMLGPTNHWLQRNFGLKLIVLHGKDAVHNGRDIKKFFRFVPAHTVMIAQYPSPNVKGVNHAVLVRTTTQRGGYALAHDPHRGGKPIEDILAPQFVYLFIPNDTGLKQFVRGRMSKGLLKR